MNYKYAFCWLSCFIIAVFFFCFLCYERCLNCGVVPNGYVIRKSAKGVSLNQFNVIIIDAKANGFLAGAPLIYRRAMESGDYGVIICANSPRDAMNKLIYIYGDVSNGVVIKNVAIAAHGCPEGAVIGGEFLKIDFYRELSQRAPYAKLRIHACEVNKGDVGRRNVNDIKRLFPSGVVAFDRKVVFDRPFVLSDY